VDCDINMKSYMSFRSVTKSVTLSDLKRRNGPFKLRDDVVTKSSCSHLSPDEFLATGARIEAPEASKAIEFSEKRKIRAITPST